jgi:hypothetical protein
MHHIYMFKYSESLFLSLQTAANKKTRWPESENELYLPSDRRLSANLVPNLAFSGCHMVSVTNSHCRNLGFLYRKTAANGIVKYSLEFCWTRSREWLFWQSPEAIGVRFRPILSSERLPHIKKPATVRRKKEIRSLAPDESPARRQTGRLTFYRKLTTSSTSAEGTPMWRRVGTPPL